MIDPELEPTPSEPVLDPETLDSGYHDDDLEIDQDDEGFHHAKPPLPKKKPLRPPPRRHYDED